MPFDTFDMYIIIKNRGIAMKCHRIEELLELLESEWNKNQDLNLLSFIVQLAKEAGYQGHWKSSPMMY